MVAWAGRGVDEKASAPVVAPSITAAAPMDAAKTGADEVAKLMAGHRGADRLTMPSCLRLAKAKNGKAKR